MSIEDKFFTECAVFGIFGHPEAANLTYLGLYALQHRGQESSGIVSSDSASLHAEIDMGWVSHIFTEERLKRLPGSMAIGHNRYSTTGSSQLKNAQPIVVDYAQGSLALAHNGNLTNADLIRGELEAYGSIFRSTTDSEVIVHLIAMSHENRFLHRATEALRRVKGAYSLLIMTEKELLAVRDPFGFRPLCLGKLGDAYIFASESCAFDIIGASYVRDIEPGEMVLVTERGLESFHPFPKAEHHAKCVFEYVYFSRPDSYIFGRNVYEVRKNLGKQLAREAYVEADMVVPVPDSGVPGALGYAEESRVPFELGLIRNHYVGRTFIEPQQSIRHFGVKIKWNPVKEAFKGKRVVVVDDSIVRGTTSRKIVEAIRNSGAKEIHVRIASPPTTNPCFYGVDTPTKAELIASSHDVEKIRQFITADSLAYLSIEGLRHIVSPDAHNFCYACYTGEYPVDPPYKGIIQLKLFGED